jgi:hypothetical protein
MSVCACLCARVSTDSVEGAARCTGENLSSKQRSELYRMEVGQLTRKLQSLLKVRALTLTLSHMPLLIFTKREREREPHATN